MSTASNVTVIPAKAQTEINRDKYHQLRVAAYCRVSTEQEEQQNSYQVQIEYYTDLINRKKEWTLAGIFADEGISGTQTKKRTEFNRMIRMCKNKKIDLVITKSISRFARNTVDCLEYVRQLKDLGIGVIFEKENINTLTMTSEFMIALYGSFAQAESESISKNVSWGKEKAFREGKVQFQYKYLLGYKKGADGKPEIVPDEAETVRLIYTLYLDGYTLLNIADTLMAQGRRTATGKNIWSKGEVQRILKNEKYVGDALLQKTFTSDCITHKVVKNNGERPMYLVTDHHAPIVDRDTYNRVYIAYGSNINLEQMKYRCPHSKVVGISEIKDYELEFRGVATIVPNKGASVPVLIWELDNRDLPTLNRYEGYPRLYRQEKMSFELDGKACTGMAYLMNYGELSPPSQMYYNTILQGYRENGLDEKYLQTALENSQQLEYYVNDEFDEDFDEDYDLDDDMQMKF